jgi:hypothetical protein
MAGAKEENGNRTHEPNLREVTAELDGLKDLALAKIEALREVMDERDKRYAAGDQSGRTAVDAALAAAKEAVQTAMVANEKAAEKTEQALKEYKSASNEWRDTVKDLVSRMPTRDEMASINKNLEEKILRNETEVRELYNWRNKVFGKIEGIKEQKNEGRTNVGLFIALVVAAIEATALIGLFLSKVPAHL